jgi:acylphosphatase
MTVALRIVIRGRVQGVGYRDSMIHAAQRLGVAGWVRNRADGAVEAFVQGDSTSVESLLDWCRRGPSLARVDAIDSDSVAAIADCRTFDLARSPE